MRCGPNKCVFGLSAARRSLTCFFSLRRVGWMDFNGWTVGWKGSPTLRCRYLPLIGPPVPSRVVCVLCVVSRPSRRFVVSCLVMWCMVIPAGGIKKISVVAVCRVPVARSALSRSGARAGLKLVRPSDATLKSVQSGAFTCVGRKHTQKPSSYECSLEKMWLSLCRTVLSVCLVSFFFAFRIRFLRAGRENKRGIGC